jgi:hypothetical protein
MANEGWYLVKVRPGFEAFVAQRLRKLDFEVILPEKTTSPQEPDQASGYVYCRFIPENRPSVISLPGVLGIVGPTSSFPHWTHE